MRSNARFERVNRALLRHRRRTGDTALVRAERAVGRVVTKDAVVDDRHQLHELRVDPLELGVQCRHVNVHVMPLLEQQVLGVLACARCRTRSPSSSPPSSPRPGSGAVTISDSDDPGVVEPGGEPDSGIDSQMRLLQRKGDQSALQRELLRSGEHEVHRRRGRRRRALLLRRGLVVLGGGCATRSRHDAAVAHRFRTVLSPEYEDPDRDTRSARPIPATSRQRRCMARRTY